MSFKISSFQKALNNAGARSSLFEVSVIGGVTNQADASEPKKTDIAGDLSFTCRATTIPGLTVTPIVTTYKGREIKIPGEMEFADWSVTIMNDNGARVRRAVERWMASINSHNDNNMQKEYLTGSATTGVYPWTGTATVTTFDKSGPSTATYEMINCWPTSIDPIDLNYDSTGTIQEYGITWAMDYWKYTKGLSTLVPA